LFRWGIFALASKVADKESSPSADRDRAEEIERAIKSLTVRQRRVIELRYGLKGEGPWTCEEIGRDYDVTPQRVKMFENMVLRRLKEASVSAEDLTSLAEWRRWRP
jgi:RNA polymerase primary sigma factor